MSELHSATIGTPAGPLTVLADPDGVVYAAGFHTDVDELLGRVHPRLRRPVRDRADLGPVTAAVRSYLDGELTAIDDVPVTQHTEGAFMAYAWQTLRQVKPGAPVTYTGFAQLAGRPRAVRAAAAACARNAVALLVPCHRVLRTDGGLGGYRWGLPVKTWLLDHELRATGATPPSPSMVESANS